MAKAFEKLISLRTKKARDLPKIQKISNQDRKAAIAEMKRENASNQLVKDAYQPLLNQIVEKLLAA